jgi:hypothetical protein
MPLAWLLVHCCLFVTFDMLETTIITDMSKIVHIFFFLLFVLISVKPTLHRHRPAANGRRGISGTPLPLAPPLAGRQAHAALQHARPSRFCRPPTPLNKRSRQRHGLRHRRQAIPSPSSTWGAAPANHMRRMTSAAWTMRTWPTTAPPSNTYSQ